jgi:hypothetical protein
MKGISQDERRGFKKYKLNYTYVNYYNNKQYSIKILEKPLLVHMSSQTYTIGNAKNVIICLGHQKH